MGAQAEQVTVERPRPFLLTLPTLVQKDILGKLEAQGLPKSTPAQGSPEEQGT